MNSIVLLSSIEHRSIQVMVFEYQQEPARPHLKGENMLDLKGFATLIVSLCLIASGTTVELWAQNDRGTITGTVTDPSGAVVVGASVTATNTGTRVSTQTTSTSSGKFPI